MKLIFKEIKHADDWAGGYSEKIFLGKTYLEKQVDNVSGNNMKSVEKMKNLLKKLNDEKDGYHINGLIKDVINEKSAVRTFPKDGKFYSTGGVMLDTANAKKEYLSNALGNAINEYGFRVNSAKLGGYEQEEKEASDIMNYYKSLRSILIN